MGFASMIPIARNINSTLRTRKYPEQTDFQIVCGIDQTTIHQNLTVRQAHDQATVYDTFEMNTIGDFPLSAEPGR